MCFFVEITKKKVEKGKPEEWRGRHFCVVFTQFWNFAYTIVIHRFFDFFRGFPKIWVLFRTCLAHILLPCPCSKQHRSPHAYSFHLRAPHTYAVQFCSTDTYPNQPGYLYSPSSLPDIQRIKDILLLEKILRH